MFVYSFLCSSFVFSDYRFYKTHNKCQANAGTADSFCPAVAAPSLFRRVEHTCSLLHNKILSRFRVQEKKGKKKGGGKKTERRKEKKKTKKTTTQQRRI
jgi:hypothetical protein